jgi:hypothetical protein
MRQPVSPVAVLLLGTLAAAPPLAAQQPADSLDLRRIFSAADSANGKPLLDTLPELVMCPQFDARKIRGDETTFSFERRPTIDENAGPVRVTLEFVVGTDGRVDRRTARVVRSGDNRLDRSFEYWVVDCRFHPGKIGDHKVRVRMQREWELRPVP